jgi:hypothetical protein
MSTQQPSRDHRRFRLATNDNETVVDDEKVLVDDDMDLEGHRLATNDNETVVPGLRRIASDDDDESPAPHGARAR